MSERNSTSPDQALVVEGGAMRGIFAAGVLDAFLEQHCQPFSSAWGVSAGSTNLIGYLCGHYGRNRQVITDHACRPDFINWKRFLRGGHLCDVHWLWHQSWKDIPLQLDRYLAGDTRLWVATTSVESGEPRYFMVDDRNLHDVFTASCSIPFAYRDFPVVNDEPMSDGGIADAIPVQEAYRQGARDITVVLSRPRSYRKPPATFRPLIRRLLRDHPELAEAVLTRGEQYNQALSFIERPPADCRVRVIAPPRDFPVSRLTTSPDKLEQGYQQGLKAGQAYHRSRGQ